MMKSKLITNFFLLVLLLCSLTVNAQKAKKVQAGDSALDFVGYDKNGEKVKLSDYKGDKYVLLNFTSIGCAPCWVTYGQMDKVQEKYKDQLKVISFHHENEDMKAKWFEIAGRYKIDFKSTAMWKVENKNKIFDGYQVPGFPYYFLIDRDQKIVDKWWGTKNEDGLDKRVKKHLPAPALAR